MFDWTTWPGLYMLGWIVLAISAPTMCNSKQSEPVHVNLF
jgi:hypothetical protein